MDQIVSILAKELSQKPDHIQNVICLLDEGNTVPFIARYRKELHGGMDDTTLRNLETRLNYLRNLQERKEEIIRSIEGQEKLTPEIEKAIDEAKTITEIDDIYRPFRPKRRTRASIAKEKGLDNGFRIVNNCGDSAGQTVKHIHFHLMGGRDFGWPAG